MPEIFSIFQTQLFPIFRNEYFKTIIYDIKNIHDEYKKSTTQHDKHRKRHTKVGGWNEREGMEHDKRRKRHTKVGGWNEREGMEMESGSPHLFCAIDHGH